MKKLEEKYENHLNIKTTRIIETNSKKGHNRCEPTPYKVLDKLFSKFNIDKTDSVVDFGCGLGRITFYIHNKFKCEVTGVEAYDNVFNELLRNKRNYDLIHSDIENPIHLEYELAEHFEILPKHNKFYFFNPFSIHIFKKVINNILNSYKKDPREIYIIIYYPLPDYVYFLKKHPDFELINKIKVKSSFDPFDKIRIYRLN